MIQKRKSKQPNRRAIQQKARELKKQGITLWKKRKFKRGEENKYISDLLKIIGRSQQQLAAMVGVSPNIIANVKSGRSPLKPELAQKIYVATGAWHVPYFRQHRGDDRLLSIYETPYTKATFEHWRKNYGRADQKSINEFFEYASDTLFVMLTAAGKCKLKNHLPALRQSFWDWCVKSYKFFQLEKPIDEVLKERKFIDELTMNYGDWRQNDLMGWREYYEFKDDKRKHNDENLTLRIEAHPGFRPCSDMKPPKNGIKSQHLTFAKKSAKN